MHALEKLQRRLWQHLERYAKYVGALLVLLSGMLMVLCFYVVPTSSICNLCYFVVFYGSLLWQVQFYSYYIRNHHPNYRNYSEWILLVRVWIHFCMGTLHQPVFTLDQQQTITLIICSTILQAIVVYALDSHLMIPTNQRNKQ
ncbi:hypothetical protein A4S06_02655 [Erysipelotrichaceae bacterium MTC7]|nr:hypothetical protein A4S06_02655 [Erysipelotrichaceae bacterium MTC7]